MIVSSKKIGRVRDWSWLLRCEDCGAERWVTQGAGPENRTEHPCLKCQNRRTQANPLVKEKRKATCLKRFGSSNAFQSPKTKQTVRQRYGVDNVFQAVSIKKKIVKTLVQNHGVQYVMQSSEMQEKARQTTMKHYGVEHPLQSNEIKAKMDFKAAWIKRHHTLKTTGAYGKRISKLETLFYEELCRLFDDVERQVMINNRSIDFFIPKLKLYVQFDGVYWHGLAGQIDESTKRGQTIKKTYMLDREQDAWFAQSGLLLVRVTDEEFKQGKHIVKFAPHLSN